MSIQFRGTATISVMGLRKERFWNMTQELQQKFKEVDRNEIEKEIDKAVEEVRVKLPKK